MKILFIGIGKMGLPMAQHLAAKGNTVKVIDQDVERIKIGIKNAQIYVLYNTIHQSNIIIRCMICCI